MTENQTKICKCYCQECKFYCEDEHAMDAHHFPVCHCPFSGCVFDEYQIEELEYLSADIL